jgi:hypothetical protein
MTLRTAVCIYHKGRLAVAHRTTGTPNDDDGGIGVLKFLWQPGNIERLRKGLQHVATLTPEGRKAVQAFPPGGMDLLETIAQATAEKPVPIWLDVDFATGCWCDWAYLVNLDQNTFEVYLLGGRGYLQWEFLKDSSTQLSRFAGVDGPAGPSLLKGFSFSQLPATKEEFIGALVAVIKEREILVDGYKWARSLHDRHGTFIL